MTPEEMVIKAADAGFHLDVADIDEPEPGCLMIDDMPASQWLEAMTMD